jgi:hypothetical protein
MKAKDGRIVRSGDALDNCRTTIAIAWWDYARAVLDTFGDREKAITHVTARERSGLAAAEVEHVVYLIRQLALEDEALQLDHIPAGR